MCRCIPLGWCRAVYSTRRWGGALWTGSTKLHAAFGSVRAGRTPRRWFLPYDFRFNFYRQSEVCKGAFCQYGIHFWNSLKKDVTGNLKWTRSWIHKIYWNSCTNICRHQPICGLGFGNGKSGNRSSFPDSSRCLSILSPIHKVSGSPPPIQWVFVALSRRIKQLWCEAAVTRTQF